ncbi:MAG: hypothetical protein DIU76_12060 [Bacillota bacterium]|nr:MAG: hypothetical protein DIU76_12060 [Bacillota bacterium]
MLAKAGWPEEKAADAVAMAARAAGDEEEHDRLRAVEDTYRGLLNEGKDVAGAALLEGVLPPQVFSALKTLVRASKGAMPKSPPAFVAGVDHMQIPDEIQKLLASPPAAHSHRVSAAATVIRALRAMGYPERVIRLIFAQHQRAFPAAVIDQAFARSGMQNGG